MNDWNERNSTPGVEKGLVEQARPVCCGAGRGTTTIPTTSGVRTATTTTRTTATTTTVFALPARSRAGVLPFTDGGSERGESRPGPGRKAEYRSGAGRLVAAGRTSPRAFVRNEPVRLESLTYRRANP